MSVFFFTLSSQKKSEPCKSWYTLPRAQTLKPKIEFQNPLAQNSPAGTSKLIPFGANSDLCWNFPAGTSELFPFGANLDLPWGWNFTDIPSQIFIFAFTGTSELIPFDANLDIRWNFPAGTSELIPFGAILEVHISKCLRKCFSII